MNWLSELACPICHGELVIYQVSPELHAMECSHCYVSYYAFKGIAFLMPESLQQDSAYRAEVNRYDEIGIRGAINYHGLSETRPITRVALLRELLRKEGVWEFVDVGSGFGYLEEATLDLNVFAIDISTELIKFVKWHNPTVRCINAAAEALPFPNGSVSCLVCDSAFQSINDRVAFLKEVERVTAPDSSLVLTIAYKWHYPRKPQDGFNILIPDELENLKKAIADMGFEAEFRYLDVDTATWKGRQEDANYLWIVGRKG